MKIGIFGGTFNPIHNGHINIATHVKETLKLDVIYFVPSYQTPDKQFSIEKISGLQRYNMIKNTIKSLKKDWIKVSDFEIKNKGISFTYKTIEHFKNTFPSSQLYLIIGEDRYWGLTNWKKYDEIMSNANIVVFRRSKKINKNIGEEVIYISDTFVPISSTEILTKLTWENIPEAAQKYIANNKLYLKSIVFNNLKRDRYQHSAAVASHAKRLSVYNKYKDKDKAYLAGLLHDLFKNKTDEELNDLYNKYEKNKEEIPAPALHGFVCALWLENVYKIKDTKFLNAIKNHTLSNPKPSKLEKIIFVADKISTDRKGDKVGKLRKLAYSNLDETYNKILRNLISKLTKQNIMPDRRTLEAYEVTKWKGVNNNEYNIRKNKKRIQK